MCPPFKESALAYLKPLIGSTHGSTPTNSRFDLVLIFFARWRIRQNDILNNTVTSTFYIQYKIQFNLCQSSESNRDLMFFRHAPWPPWLLWLNLFYFIMDWWIRQDLNLWPSGCKPGALANWATDPVKKWSGADERIWTSTGLRPQAPQACLSADSNTSA